MGIDHCGADVLVTKQLLDRPDVVAVLKQMGPKRMTKSVATHWLGDSGFPDGFLYRPLRQGLMKMISPSAKGAGLNIGLWQDAGTGLAIRQRAGQPPSGVL